MTRMLRPALRAFVFLALALPLAACTPNSRTGSYLLTVREAGYNRAVEGASVEVFLNGGGGGSGQRVTSTTDAKGESVVVLPAFSRAELRVGFDGETDRYFVRPTRIRAWSEPRPTEASDLRALIFVAGMPAGPTPTFDVDFVFLRAEGPR